MWKPRVLIEMKKAGTDLSRHFRQAFEYWQQAVPDRPRYVVLCNFDEFWVYDFDVQLDAPMDVVKIDGLLPSHFFTRTVMEANSDTFVDANVRPDASLQVFAFDDDYSFGVLSSGLHRAWFDERCSKLETRPRYTPTTVWNTFPWPLNPSEQVVAKVAEVAGRIIEVRSELLDRGMILGAMYDALRQPGKSALRDLHEELDAAVLAAYGFNPDEDLLAQLLALNLAYGADPEAAQRPGGSQFGDSAYASGYRLAPAPIEV